MQKQKNKKLKKFEKKGLDVLDRFLRILWRKKVDKRELDILDRFLRILWRKEVEYKINI